MLIEQGDICIINPKDEEPHNEVSTKRMIHFQHGDTKVSNNDMSTAFVFIIIPKPPFSSELEYYMAQYAIAYS